MHLFSLQTANRTNLAHRSISKKISVLISLKKVEKNFSADFIANNLKNISSAELIAKTLRKSQCKKFEKKFQC
jgi:predicted nucleic acid-binding protein